MTTAFQTLLSNVSDMGLNEGDFLRMNNLLKKAYDQDKKEVSTAHTLTKPIDMHILLKDTLDKRVLELHISEITRRLDDRMRERHFDYLPLVSINGHFKTDIHTSPITFTQEPELTKFLQCWIKRVRPMTIAVATGPAGVGGGFETTYTFKNVLASCKAEDEADEDVDEDYCDYDYGYMVVMGNRFVEMFQHFLRSTFHNTVD
jgi:hypothetical protein